mgnify:CR=1 FL=1|tara:strand:+ start:2551 stop:2796 length:246 start_codon:yes stop_codon:yes gene_type:complete
MHCLQQAFAKIANFVLNTHLFFARNFIFDRKYSVTKLATSQSAGTSGCEKTKSEREDIRTPIGEKFHSADSQEAFLSLFTD